MGSRSSCTSSAGGNAARSLWGRARPAGIRSPLPQIGSRPHISVAVFDRIDPTRVRPELEELASTLSPAAHSDAVGAFPAKDGVVFPPGGHPQLLELHQSVHARLDALGLRA